jgi:hypothetical protein
MAIKVTVNLIRIFKIFSNPKAKIQYFSHQARCCAYAAMYSTRYGLAQTYSSYTAETTAAPILVQLAHSWKPACTQRVESPRSGLAGQD